MEMYTPKDLRMKLYIGRTKAYELLKSGKVKSIRVGRQYRIPRRELEKFMEVSQGPDLIRDDSKMGE